jgi:hypothetical protein
MKLAWDDRQPARTSARKKRKPAVGSNLTENTGLCVIVICEV